MRKRLTTGFSVGIMGVLGACSAPVGEPTETIGTSTSELVAGALAVTPFGGPEASETSTLVNVSSAGTHKVVVFNYEDPAHTTYPNDGLQVCSGASAVGWNYATGGNTTDSFTTVPKRLNVPSGWPILWSDPSVGQIKGTPYVYMTVLAVPTFNMHGANCVQGPFAWGNPPQSHIGGACIARFTNGGVSFSIASSNDCVHAAAGFDFYDGADITGRTNGEVLAAFNNSTRGTIDVFRAASATGTFTQVANPFPNLTMSGHPRFNPGGPYLLARDRNTNLWLQQWTGTGWGSAANGYPKLVGTQATTADLNLANNVIMRRGGQWDLAVRTPYALPPRVLIVYAKAGQTHAILSASEFDTGPGWVSRDVLTIDPGVNVFHPTIASAFIAPTPPGPGGSTRTVWSWMQQDGDQMRIVGGLYGDTVGISQTSTTPTCPDGGGYWGDYDGHMGVYQATSSSQPLFWRSFSDSTDSSGTPACTAAGSYWSKNVNVSTTSIVWPP